VVLKATPEDVEAGVQVGDSRYRFYPGSAVAWPIPRSASGSSRFATIRMSTRASWPTRAMPRATSHDAARAPAVREEVRPVEDSDRPEIPRSVVPAIASNTPELKIDTGSPDGLLKGFLENQRQPSQEERRFHRLARGEERAAHAVDRSVRADGEFAG
jgi:hypothetical protein